SCSSNVIKAIFGLTKFGSLAAPICSTWNIPQQQLGLFDGLMRTRSTSGEIPRIASPFNRKSEF
ncbi:MAG: hypothetical protein WAK20_18680, partial [Candidatus Acidiferrum sp.]